MEMNLADDVNVDVPAGVGVTDPTLGLGLAGIVDWSTEFPFLDIMKQARPWMAGGLGLDFGGLQSGGYLDANGWPTSIPDGAYDVQTVWDVPPGTAGAEGPWVLTWEGEGTLSINGVEVTSSSAHRIEFTNTGADSFFLSISSTDPNDNGNYIKDIHIVPARYEALADAGEIFNPDWLALIDDVRQVRFMDWMETNGSTQVDWADRPNVDSFSYMSGFGRGTYGVPVEVMVQLANKIGADAWFNMPHMASDDYITQFATYVRDHLNPDLVATVEYSNEMWNWAFPQTQWANAQAQALWGTDPVGGMAPTNLDYLAMRATQVAAIWDTVFGDQADDRVQDALNLQNGNSWWLQERILNGYVWQAKGEGFIDPKSVLDAIAVTTYFGNVQMSDATLRNDLLAYLGSHTLEQTYNWLADQLSDPKADYSIPFVAGLWAQVKAVTDAAGLDLIAYEGGQHVHAFVDLPQNEQDILTAFFIGFVRSPQMAELYQKLWDAWAEVSDGPFMHFTDVGVPTKYGSWGLLKDLDDTNPRAEFLFDKNAQGDAWFGDGGGTRYQQGVIKIAASDTGETLIGTNKDDVLVGGDGDDTFIPGLGNDRINGGKGNDTAIICGNRSDYSLAGSGKAWQIKGRAGAMLVVEVETLLFTSDKEFEAHRDACL